MLILAQQENKQCQVHMLKYTSFESSQTHHLPVMYRFERIFSFQNLYKPF